MNVVLLHGLFGFRSLLSMAYFNGVESFLKARFPASAEGVELKVLSPRTPPIGTIAHRGARLREQILAALGDGALSPDHPLYLIAHSMGGLDARWLASPANADNLGDRIAAIATIATPHRGSPLADIATSVSWDRYDGMVALSSAQWGDEPMETWPGDHVDVLNHDLDRGSSHPSSQPVLERYFQLLRRLSAG